MKKLNGTDVLCIVYSELAGGEAEKELGPLDYPAGKYFSIPLGVHGLSMDIRFGKSAGSGGFDQTTSLRIYDPADGLALMEYYVGENENPLLARHNTPFVLPIDSGSNQEAFILGLGIAGYIDELIKEREL